MRNNESRRELLQDEKFKILEKSLLQNDIKIQHCGFLLLHYVYCENLDVLLSISSAF